MKKSIIKSSVLVLAISILAKFIGFIKSIIQASYFGATFYTDAYNVAHGFVGNVLFLFTTAISVAFVPLYIQHKKQNNEKKFASIVITDLMLIGVGISLLLIAAAPLIVRIIAPSFEGEKATITIQYFRVFAIGFIFSLVANLFTKLLNSEKIYGYSALGSVLNSLVLVAAILLFAKMIGVWTLVISVPLSYFFQWIILYIKGKKYASFTFKYGLKDDSIKLLLAQSFPILISQATVEINQVIDRALLTSIGEGIVTAVSYSIVLYQFAITLIDAPRASVMFTELSEAGAEADGERIRGLLNSVFKVICVFCIPIVAVMFFGANDIVSIVYSHGKFTQEAVNNSAIGLQMYSLCLLPVCLRKLMGSAFYAVNDTRRPMMIGIFEVVMNITLSLLLVKPFGIYGVVGATAMASFTFVLVMFFVFNKKQIKLFDRSILRSYWKIALGFFILAAIMLFIPRTMHGNTILNFIFKTGISFGTFWLILLALKEPTVHVVIRKGLGFFHKKLKLKKAN